MVWTNCEYKSEVNVEATKYVLNCEESVLLLWLDDWAWWLSNEVAEDVDERIAEVRKVGTGIFGSTMGNLVSKSEHMNGFPY